MPNEMSKISDRPINLVGMQNKQGTGFAYAEAETGRPVHYNRETGETRNFPKPLENVLKRTQSPKLTYNPVATHAAAERQQNESYSNRRLNIILETVSEILEDAERARSRREHRKKQAAEGVRDLQRRVAHGNAPALFDLKRIAMATPHSLERSAMAAELLKARADGIDYHFPPDPDLGQKVLDVYSYPYSLTPSYRTDRYKARKKSRKK